MTQCELFAIIIIIIWSPVRSPRIYEANWPSFWGCFYKKFPCGLPEHDPAVASWATHAVSSASRMWEQVPLAVIPAAASHSM